MTSEFPKNVHPSSPIHSLFHFALKPTFKPSVLDKIYPAKVRSHRLTQNGYS
jgi:hypothetical protein